MRITIYALLAIGIIQILGVLSFGQDPMPVLNSSWQPSVRHADDPAVQTAGPARVLTADDKNFQKKAREQRTDNPLSPDKDSIDARSATIERNVEEASTSKAPDVNGFSYTASVRNDTDRVVKIVFWEYRFTELANPSNVVTRQFLCSVNLKKGATIALSAFSLLGPSNTIDAASLAKSTDKLFDERVQVNRLEFADDKILQRGGWKIDDVKASVDRITSMPWGHEVCRVL